MSRKFISTLTLVVLLCSFVVSRAEDHATLAREANRSSIEAIHSFSCEIEVCPTSPDNDQVLQNNKGFYWRRGKLARQKQGSKDLWHEVLTGNEVTRGLHTSPNPQNQILQRHGSISSPTTVETLADVWHWTLCDVPSASVSLDEWLQTVEGSVKSRREKNNCVRLECKEKDSRHTFWLDPQYNYLVSRYSLVDTTGRVEIEVKRFREVNPGMYFPELIEQSIYNKSDQRTHLTRIVLRNIQVNKPLPDDLFRLDFPEGTIVGDQIAGTIYEMGKGGPKLGTLRKVERSPSLPPMSDKSYQGATVTEPRSSWRWIVIGICTPMTLVAGFLLWRQRRKPFTG